MDHQTLSHAPVHRRQPDATHSGHSNNQNPADRAKTVRVKIPSLFIYYAMDSFETLH